MTSMPLPIDPAHPAFAGHFPSRPVLPGAVLLDHGLRAVAAHRAASSPLPLEPSTTCRIGVAKFLSFVGPGEPVRLEFDRAAASVASRSDWLLRIYAGPPEAERLAMTGSVSFDVAEGG